MKFFLLSCLLIYIIGIGSTEAKHQEERPKIGLVLVVAVQKALPQ